MATAWFVALRRRFRHSIGRELGFAHATRLLARFLPEWQELPLEGPDGRSLFLDLRQKEGYLVGGFANTIAHMAPLIELVRPGDTVIDVGANIGVWSRKLLAHRALGALYAFEPETLNFQVLQKNLAEYPAAHCEKLAVGAENGFARFSEMLDSGQNFVVTELRSARRYHEVPIVTLDAWAERIGLSALDVLKVDVEGLELEVFLGAEAVLRRFMPVVYFEYLPESGELGRKKGQAFRWLAALGYTMQAVRLDGSSVEVATPEACDLVEAFSHDVIAVPRRDRSR